MIKTKKNARHKISAIIFDMDGLLIDSEPLWHTAEIETAKLVGINLTRESCLETTGLRVDEVVGHWFRKQPWENISKKEISDEIVKKVISLITEKGREKEGARQALEFAKKKNLKIALASSSSMAIINAVIKKLSFENFFDETYSAEFEKYGKPHPGVYLTAMKRLNELPENCLAVEDSLNGLLSAKAAKIKCVCVPDQSIAPNPKLFNADFILPSLLDFNEEFWNNCASINS